MNKKIQIEKMQIEDYDEIYDLWINTPGMGLNLIDDSKEGIIKYLNRNPNSCLVARVNETIVGTIMAGHDGRRGNIHHTAVMKDYRLKGIGKELANRAVQALLEEGIHKVSFVVFKQNKEGNAFWAKSGFSAREDLVYRDKIISNESLIVPPSKSG